MSVEKLNDLVLTLLSGAKHAGHVVIGVALVAATALISVHFVMDVFHAVSEHTLIHGFLRALGILLLLWTMLELIQTEIGFLRGEPIDVSVFVEVALIVVVREIILLPVENTQPTFEDVGKWAVTAALLGLTYVFLKFGHSKLSGTRKNGVST